MEEVKKIQKDLRTIPESIFNVIGIYATVFISFLIANRLNLIPSTIWEGAFVFVGLPFLFIFILGIIRNDPHFGVRTKWGLGIYLIISLGTFMYMFADTSSVTYNLKLIGQYIIGVLIVFISAIFYVIPERWFIKNQYRTRVMISLSLSISATIGFILLLRKFGIINLIS